MGQEPDDPRGFSERLRAARERQGLDPRPTRPEPSGAPDPSAFAVGARVALDLVSALLVACAIGWGLDRLFGTKPWFLIGFVPLGGAAGVLNVWRMFAPDPKAPGPDRRKTGPDPGR
jgi:ATP synthase protein I